MPIDVEKVLAADLPAATSSWTPDDVILYHLPGETLVVQMWREDGKVLVQARF